MVNIRYIKSSDHDSAEVRPGQQPDVARDLDVHGDRLTLRHVYEAASRAGLHHPVAGQESDGACMVTSHSHSHSHTVTLTHSPRLLLFVLIFLKLFRARTDLISLKN